MKIAKVLIGAGVGALVLSGCMTEEPVQQRASDERIEIIENRSFDVELLSAKTLINDEGLLTVDASVLLSRTGYFRWVFAGDPKVTIWYHFDWIDAQGNIYPPVQREMTALPGNIIDFHGVAPEEKYINYHLTISLKGPETDQEAARQQDEIRQKYTASGSVKPAGKSSARQTVKSGAKAEAKPAPKAEVKKAEAQPAPKAEVKKAEAQPAPKTEVKKAEAQPASKSGSQSQKLTEPFD